VHILSALVDMGAETDLIRKDLLPMGVFAPSKQPISLLTADGTRMEGGAREVSLKLCFMLPPNSEGKTEWCTQAVFHDADLQVDGIFSHPWLRNAYLGVITP